MDLRASSTHGSEPEAIVHGGNLDEISRLYPDAPRPWIDLSTGINPIAYPIPSLPTEAWSRLPTKADERALLVAATRRYGVRAPASIVAAPGTQALLQILPRLRPSGSVAVLAPTYEEHALCWRRCEHEVRLIDKIDALAGVDVAVVVNPNNPTGRVLSRERLTALATKLAKHGGLLILDEAFADVLPADVSLLPELPPSTLVLRSFGKTYGLAGLRLGFAIADDELARKLRDELGPWAVSGPALAIGTAALADDVWLSHTRERLIADSRRLDQLLIAAGCGIIGGTPLFRLAEHADAEALADRLARHGIHVRRFPCNTAWLRFGLPGDKESWQRLEAALMTI
ncbi:threonine-phosphate decarboxylase CobD [Bradyrhizobium sp. STM 3557]|uniref:threonine-phosphate decarboxylase CobD n=1 Tax=Bradyrhizobium sp. STM 3557 TaxID=578920 RepID=UPI00388F6490